MKTKSIKCNSCGGKVVFASNKEGLCEYCGTTHLQKAEQGEIEIQIKRVKSFGEGSYKFSLVFEDGTILPFVIDKTVEYKTSYADNKLIIKADGTLFNKKNSLLQFTVKKGIKSVYIELDRADSFSWNAKGDGFSSIDVRKMTRKETKENNKKIKQFVKRDTSGWW